MARTLGSLVPAPRGGGECPTRRRMRSILPAGPMCSHPTAVQPPLLRSIDGRGEETGRKFTGKGQQAGSRNSALEFRVVRHAWCGRVTCAL